MTSLRICLWVKRERKKKKLGPKEVVVVCDYGSCAIQTICTHCNTLVKVPPPAVFYGNGTLSDLKQLNRAVKLSSHATPTQCSSLSCYSVAPAFSVSPHCTILSRCYICTVRHGSALRQHYILSFHFPVASQPLCKNLKLNKKVFEKN